MRSQVLDRSPLAWTQVVLRGLIALLTVAVGVTAAGVLGNRSAPSISRPAVVSRALPPDAALTALPLAAQGPISMALGRDDHAYWVRGDHATNPAQNLEAGFSAAGVSVTAGASHLRMSLTGIGRSGAMHGVGSVRPTIDANRVVYDHAGVREWYANGPIGLEQGFDVLRAPAGGSGRLTLSVALAGNLHPRLQAGGVVFTGAAGSLRYAGLVAVDRHGRRLPASIAVNHGHLIVSVDDRHADYPVRVDPFVQDAELTSADASAAQGFGYSSAVSGYVVAVGSPVTPVGNNTNQGAVFVFTEPSSGWANTTQSAELTASDGAKSDELGFSVEIDGATIVAGSPSHGGTGAAYVYTQPASGGWASATQTAELTPTGPSAGYMPIAISGSTIVIGRAEQGTPQGSGSAPGGAVDVFVKGSGAWTSSGTPQAVLTNSVVTTDQQEGIAVAIDGNEIVAGARDTESSSGGGTVNNGVADVYVEPPSGAWQTTGTPTARLETGAATVYSGAPSLAIDAGTVAIGNSYAPVGANNDQGAVYVFSEAPGGWTNLSAPTATLTNSAGVPGEDLGFTVGLSGTTIVAGAPSAPGGGAVDVFTEPASGGWQTTGTPTQTLTTSVSSTAALGYSVGYDGTTIVSGARFQGVGEFVYQLPGTPTPTTTGTTTTTTTTTTSGPTAAPVDTVAPVITGTAKKGQKLTCPTGTWTNNPNRYTYQWNRDGTPIAGATNPTYTVGPVDEGLTITCTVTAANTIGTGKPATSKGLAIPVPKVTKCPAATGTLSGTKLGLVKLGMTRTAARHAFTKSSNRGQKYEDFFCLTPIGIRVGYGSPKLAKKYRDHVIWASTSSAYYAIKGIRVGAAITTAATTLKLTGPYTVGKNTWYLTTNGSSNAIFKTRTGTIQEIGIAQKALTNTKKADLTFLKSFS